MSRVNLQHRFYNARTYLMLLSYSNQCLRILGETRAAKTGARVQKLLTNTAIQTHAFGNRVHVRTDFFAEH